MKVIITVISFFIVCIASSQTITFVRSYGGTGFDYGRDVKQDIDTGYICTGSSSSFSPDNGEAFLLKTDSLGQFQWSYHYGGTGSDWGEAVIVTKDSVYALGGYTNSFGAGGFDFYLVKAGTQGTPIFEKTYGGSDWDKAYDIGQLPDSGFVLVGETYSYGAGQRDCYIVRTDKNGDTLWTKTWGGPEDDFLNAVWIDGDSIVAAGGTYSYGSGMSDGLILKFGSDGNLGWSYITGSAQEDYFNCIEGDASYYFLGGLCSKDYFNTYEDQWLFKIENDTSIVYNDTYYMGAVGQNERVMDLTIRFNGDVVFASVDNSFGIGAGYGDILLSKWTSNFAYVASNWYGSALEDIPYGIDDTYDGGIITIADYDGASLGGQNFILMKKNIGWDWLNFAAMLEYDSITSAIPHIENSMIDINPTYVSQDLQIRGINNIQTISVFNLEGKQIFQKDVNQEVGDYYTLDVSFLQSGMYILTIVNNGSRYSQKFIKE